MTEQPLPFLIRDRATVEAEIDEAIASASSVATGALIAGTPGTNPWYVEEAEAACEELDRLVGEVLKRSFSTSVVFEEYAASLSVSVVTDDPGTHVSAVRRRVRETQNFLSGLRKRLYLYERPAEMPQDILPAFGPRGSAVLLVHGRDHAMRDAIHVLLQQIGADVTVLEDTPNMGRHLIEKFEDSARHVDFVVAAASGDDEGRLRPGLGAPGQPDQPLAIRARQNVIFEIGYVFGRLGRGRSAVVYGQGVQLPSDINGIAYIPFEGDWKLRLVKELRAAKLNLQFDRLTG